MTDVDPPTAPSDATHPENDSLGAILREIERWFVRRGLPHFIVDYRAVSRVWTRALPVLPLAYLAGAANGINHDYSFLANVGAVLGALALVVAVWALARRLRRSRGVGTPELVAFVLGPSVPALVFGFQWRSALVSAVVGVVVLGIVYAVTSYGLIPMTRWAVGRLVQLLAELGQLFVRALPMLLLFVTFLFINAEVWQVSGLLYGLAYPITLLVFVVAGAVFVLSHLPQDVKSVGHFDSWDEVCSLAHDTPAAALGSASVPNAVPEPDPANWREWLNLGLLMLFSRAVQITLVALLIGGFFVVFGILTMDAKTIGAWTGEPPNVLFTLTLSQRPLVLTEQLLRVAGFLAAFTGLNFTVYLVTDSVYKEAFKADVVSDVRQAFAVRALYLAHCAERGRG